MYKNLDPALRVTRALLGRYGPKELLRVEELRPGLYRGILADGVALAVVREDGGITVSEVEPCW